MTTRGSIDWPLTSMVRDTIDTHGLRWAMAYYAARLSSFELRVIMRGAYV